MTLTHRCRRRRGLPSFGMTHPRRGAPRREAEDVGRRAERRQDVMRNRRHPTSRRDCPSFAGPLLTVGGENAEEYGFNRRSKNVTNLARRAGVARHRRCATASFGPPRHFAPPGPRRGRGRGRGRSRWEEDDVSDDDASTMARRFDVQDDAVRR